jgi:hypothetical protein
MIHQRAKYFLCSHPCSYFFAHGPSSVPMHVILFSMFSLLFNCEDGGSRFLQIVVRYLPNYMISHPMKR